jgi:hypothetical protein
VDPNWRIYLTDSTPEQVQQVLGKQMLAHAQEKRRIKAHALLKSRENCGFASAKV